MSYEYLAHHGILGQRWGVRRFQNKDGSYTSKGRDRHADVENKPKNTERGQAAQTKWRAAKTRLKKAKATGDKESIQKAKANYKKVNKATKKDRLYRYNSDDKLNDMARYGLRSEKASERIEKRINEKGMTRRRARKKENNRQFVEGLLVTAGVTLATSPEARQMAANGTKATATAISNLVKKANKASKARKAIPKIGVNKKFNPIDTTMRIL